MNFCGLSEATKNQYIYIADRYLEFTRGSPTWSRSEIMTFIASLGEVSPSYSSWVLSIVRRFHFSVKDILLEKAKKWPLGPREGPRPKYGPQPYFDEKMIKKLLSIIPNIRDLAIARLLYATGARRDEVCRLDRSNYSGENIYILMAKGEEGRTVRLDPGTRRVLNEYLESRSDKQKALFLNDHGKRYTPEALSQVFRKYFKALKLEPRTGFHAFRRGLVTLLNDRGLSEDEIMKWMGWRTSTMVHRYCQVRPSKLREKVEKVHPFYEKR